MLNIKSLFIAACIIASTSLFGQPINEDIILLYGPSNSETMDQIDVVSTYMAPVSSNDEAYVLTPSGSVVQTDAGKLAVFVDENGQTGSYRFYFPMAGLRTELIVE